MVSRLRNYLLDAYENRRNIQVPRKLRKDNPIQIDDQDDNDNLNDFCNIFCTVRSKDTLQLEMVGNFPITTEIADLIEIYDGVSDPLHGRITFNINLHQIEVVSDLADKIRKTSFMGHSIQNPGWLRISSRTISSLYRFVRIIKEYRHFKKLQ